MATIDLNLFFLAASAGDVCILKKCLNSGIDVHSYDDLALRLAVKGNHSKAILFLLARDANVQAVYDDELRHASLMGETEKVRTLLENYSCSETAKVFAMYNAIFGRNEAIINLLLQNGVSPEVNNGALLNVVRLCNNDQINKLFKDYLK